MFKNIVRKKLQKYVQKYFIAHPEVKLIVVAGSVGKTSTKRAMATILSQRYRVRMHTGNHNSEISAPLAILGVEFPKSLKNPLSWLGVFRAAKHRIKNPAEAEIIIQELGSDHPGEIQQFGEYLNPDIALVTAVTPEHMEFFKNIQAVAIEELSVGDYSKQVLINRDDIASEHAAYMKNPNFNTYGTTGMAEYHIEITDFSDGRTGLKGMITAPELETPLSIETKVVGEHSLRSVAGAVAVGLKMGLTPDEILAGIAAIEPVPGRMNPLSGMGQALIIDDTYNSSPAAAAAALQALYQFEGRSQRIAVLGDMNELGDVSADEHAKLGALCSPDLLAWVVVVGKESAQYLAPVAKQRGNQVKICRDAIEAGKFVRSVSQSDAVILVKGSQGGVYLEEAVKILASLGEYDELVRQSPKWMKIKQQYFDSL